MRMIEKVAAGRVGRFLTSVSKAIPKDVKGAARSAYEKTKKDVVGSKYVTGITREGKRRMAWDQAFKGKTRKAVTGVKTEAKKRVKGALSALGGGS